MTQKQIGFMACRIMGILNFITALIFLSQFTISLRMAISSILLPGLLFLSVSLGLWFGAEMISDYLFLGDGESQVSSSITLNEAQTTVLILMGIYILATTLPQLISSLVQIFMIKSQNIYPVSNLYSGLITPFLKVLLGGVLIITPSGILGLTRKVREAGLSENK